MTDSYTYTHTEGERGRRRFRIHSRSVAWQLIPFLDVWAGEG